MCKLDLIIYKDDYAQRCDRKAIILQGKELCLSRKTFFVAVEPHFVLWMISVQ